MDILKRELLDPDRFMYHDYNAYRRGSAYYQEGRVIVQSFDGHETTCRVHGHHGIYSVAITAASRGSIDMTCTCPQAERAPICKHMIASLFAIQKYLDEEGGDQWRYRLMQALDVSRSSKSTRTPRARYAILFGLRKESSYYAADHWRLVSFRLNLKDWSYAEQFQATEDREQQNLLLDQHRSWTYSATTQFRNIDERTVVNTTNLGVNAYNMIGKEGQLYFSPNLADYLPVLRSLNLPIFLLGNNGHLFEQRLLFIDAPGRFEAALAKEGEDFTIHAGMQVNGERFSTIKSNLELISTSPAWVLAGSHLMEVENPEALELIQYFPLHIPKEEVQEFRDEFLPELARRIPLGGDVFSWTELDGPPVPRLYLSDNKRTLMAEMRFGYGDQEVEFSKDGEILTVRGIPGSWGMARIHRDPDKETDFYQMLTQARYGLKRSVGAQKDGMFELRARTHPLDFLTRSIPLLIEAGFEIYGEDNLKIGRINRSKPTISLNITSGIDWFDLNAVVSYGDQQVGLGDIRRALRRKEKYVKLADGSIGQIPDEWLDRYKQLFDMAEETDDGLRVRDFHLTLVDQLLQDASETNVAAEYRRRRERLRGFEQIDPQPVPAGFTGELRSYQKAGLEWLHFLHDYGFGGCLADDMGLGKTIEVLAFLQSLREQGKTQSASLLVVPKSLLANWQREVERFTPGLKVLEYFGAGREKDTAIFDGCDVILTTYGTMLRDVNFLRGYTFDYAILDESQAIKNPMAQTAKAARLLQARHKLVMTGTPVENNTFDLWSQFAFLNPGLLGSLDYFKHEFASPVEKNGSDDTLQSLRKLVYPFILRRTKEQVAPELPPRTERVLYVDLEPAQRKLYEHTRTYYRKSLMGLIEEEGMDQARMKILEGLLRLRQICIHPALVESGFKGKVAKFETLMDTLDSLHAEGHKALIFSQFVKTLHMLEKELKSRDLRYVYLDGQTNNRQERVDRFQNEADIPFFLISLKAGGVGLNLTAADYVINIDPWWNPAVEMQAADRAHRIGQDKPVFIYKLIARDTVEEKILQLQEKKKDLVEQIISTESSFFKSLSKEDVGALFS